MTLLLREAIGDTLRRTRTSQERTLREVSSSAQVSLGYLSEVERGRKEASSELLAAICRALDVPVSELLFDVGSAMAMGEGIAAAVSPEAMVAAGEKAFEPVDGIEARVIDRRKVGVCAA